MAVAAAVVLLCLILLCRRRMKARKLASTRVHADLSRARWSSRRGSFDKGRVRALEGEVEWDPEQPHYYFLTRLAVLDCKSTSLPHMQQLRSEQLLKRKTVDIADAYRGAGFVKKVLFVSHRWEAPGVPDSTGTQLRAIQAHLRAHPALEFVWFDYACMAQNTAGVTRSRFEQKEFELMLNAITDLYLTSHVLIIMDNTYVTRFWTLMEAWCAMMTTSESGVRAASEAEKRYTIACIHEADPEFDVPKLVRKLSKKTPGEVRRTAVHCTALRSTARRPVPRCSLRAAPLRSTSLRFTSLLFTSGR